VIQFDPAHRITIQEQTNGIVIPAPPQIPPPSARVSCEEQINGPGVRRFVIPEPTGLRPRSAFGFLVFGPLRLRWSAPRRTPCITPRSNQRNTEGKIGTPPRRLLEVFSSKRGLVFTLLHATGRTCSAPKRPAPRGSPCAGVSITFAAQSRVRPPVRDLRDPAPAGYAEQTSVPQNRRARQTPPNFIRGLAGLPPSAARLAISLQPQQITSVPRNSSRFCSRSSTVPMVPSTLDNAFMTKLAIRDHRQESDLSRKNRPRPFYVLAV